MLLNLIFTKINLKKRVKTIEEYRNEQSISEMFEQNKLKQLEKVLRQLY